MDGVTPALGFGAAFANIRRFLTYHLTDNVAELAPFVVWALSGGRVPLALGVLQSLCLDRLTDQAPALALGAQPPRARALAYDPRPTALLDRRLLLRAGLVLGATEATVALLAFFGVLLAAGFRLEHGAPPPSRLSAASGSAFLAVIAGQRRRRWPAAARRGRPGECRWPTTSCC